jgi:hypothetical protein
MVFGTLVTQARREQDQDTWRRDLEAVSVAPPGRWRAFWRAVARWFD